jgi:hypothetical protein
MTMKYATLLLGLVASVADPAARPCGRDAGGVRSATRRALMFLRIAGFISSRRGYVFILPTLRALPSTGSHAANKPTPVLGSRVSEAKDPFRRLLPAYEAASSIFTVDWWHALDVMP